MEPYIYSDIYRHIASYLGDINTIQCLDPVCQAATGYASNPTLAKKLLTFPKQDRFIEACRMGYMDGIVYYFDVDKKQEAFKESCINRLLDVAQ